MKISEGMNILGPRTFIPNTSRNDLPELFIERGYKVGVEVGVGLGEYSEILCKSGLQIYSVDSWRSSEDFPVYRRGIERIYEQAKARLSVYPNNTIIRKSSMDAVTSFKNESIDFVYIDGNHWLRFVIDDIYEWSKKVKVGGIISGHDYYYRKNRGIKAIHYCHVGEAVDVYTKVYEIPNWYVIGHKVDKYPSFLWEKK